MNTAQHKGIIHFHTSASFDCLSSPKAILRFARRQGLTFLIPTDHDTVAGAMRLREQARREGLELEIPIAAEYHTNYGDIIAAFIRDEIHTRDFDELLAETSRQGGITLLPHPFRSHTNLDYIAQRVDLIEVYNSRQSVVDDRRAEALARKYAKRPFYGSDAHLVSDLSGAIVMLEKKGELKDDLLAVPMAAPVCRKTTRRHVHYSQLIGAVRTGNLIRTCVRKMRRGFGYERNTPIDS